MSYLIIRKNYGWAMRWAFTVTAVYTLQLLIRSMANSLLSPGLLIP